MKLTSKLRESFCKDTGIPLEVFVEPYFTDRLYLYDGFYDCLKPWELFNRAVVNSGDYGDQYEYFEKCDTVVNAVLEHIRASNGYWRFNSSLKDPFASSSSEYKKLFKKSIYKDKNVGKTYISVSMPEEGFTGLRHYDRAIFDDCFSWKEFLGKFTDNEYILNNKSIRRRVFDSCSPKRQAKYGRHLMGKVTNCVLGSCCDELSGDLKPVSLHSSEVVFDISKVTDVVSLRAAVSLVRHASASSIPTNVECFVLHKVPGNHEGYYKDFILESDKIPKFEGVSPNALPFIIRYMRGEEVAESDKVFVFEGKLVKYL